MDDGISFTVQMLVATVLVLLPLIYTEALPKQQLMSFLEAPTPPPGPAPRRLSKTSPAKQVSELDDGVNASPPAAIPRRIAMVKEEEGPPSGAAEIPGTIPGGSPGGVPNSVVNIVRDIPVAVPKIAAQKVRVSSGVAQGLLVRQVTPQYPPLARQARRANCCKSQFSCHNRSMFTRKIRVEYEENGRRLACPLKWLDSFSMRNFTNDQVFDDTIPMSDGEMEIGSRVPVERLRAAMEDWFRRKSYLPQGATVMVEERQASR